MNRTRKIAAAGIGTAVILVVIAMMLVSPNLHTQTPVTTTPPGGGGTGNGGTGGNGTRPGTNMGNTTSPSCAPTGGDHEWDDENETEANGSADQAWTGGNETNDTASQGASPCGSTAGDRDSHGDQESEQHASPHANLGEDSLLTGDLIAFAQDLSVLMASAESGLVSLGGSVIGLFATAAMTLHGVLISR